MIKSPKSAALAAKFPKPAPTIGRGLRDNNVRHPVTQQFIKTKKKHIEFTNQGDIVGETPDGS